MLYLLSWTSVDAGMRYPTITNDRYQAQWKGEGWHVFDSHTNGWGAASFAKAKDAQQAADALNAV